MINREGAEKLWQNLLDLGPRRLIALAVIGTAVFLAIAGGAYYLSRPELDVLYTGLSRDDVGRIAVVLRDSNINFDVNSAGDTVMVKPSQTTQARSLLAEKGLPTSSGAGYELFDKIGSLGLTSFMQEITRVRALEGEIARSVQVMKGVKAARVHIVLPVRGSFRREQQPPSASVVIRTDGAADARTAQSIRQLVAAAVPGMTADKVTVLDSDGTLLLAEEDPTTAAPTKLAGLQKVVGRMVQENIRRALVPYLGLDNFEVAASAQLSTDKRQINETVYDPESRAERSVRSIREKETSQNSDKQVPTTVQQNLPDQQVNANNGKSSNDEKQRREDTTNYELSSKTITTVSDGYVVNKLSVALLVNRPRLLSVLGDKADAAAMDAKIAEITQLASSAAGLDKARGDQIHVSAVEFLEGTRDLVPVPPLSWPEVLNRQLGSLISAITILTLAVLLIWFGLRPAMDAILTRPTAAEVEETEAAAAAAAAEAGAGAEQSSAAQVAHHDTPNLVEDLTSKVQRAPQRRLEQIVQLNEEQAAAILKQWMRQEEMA
jgi:flagellar M-ring protein FliF